MKTLIVVAHADDETIAASRLMGTFPADCIVLHTTDSAPKNPKYFERRRRGHARRAGPRLARHRRR